MKKVLVLILVAVCFLGFVACPPPKPPPVRNELPPPPPPPPVDVGLVLDGAGSHTVAAGDTLADIAASRYGGSNMYFFPLIRLANASAVPNADVIEVGTNLVIPNLQRNLDSVGANALVRADMLNIAAQYDREEKPNAAATLRRLATRLSQ